MGVTVAIVMNAYEDAHSRCCRVVFFFSSIHLVRFLSPCSSIRCRLRLQRERSLATSFYLSMSMSTALMSLLQTSLQWRWIRPRALLPVTSCPNRRNFRIFTSVDCCFPCLAVVATLEDLLKGAGLGRVVCPCSTTSLSTPSMLTKGKVDSNITWHRRRYRSCQKETILKVYSRNLPGGLNSEVSFY